VRRSRSRSSTARRSSGSSTRAAARPIAPDPAYQQIIKGMPAVDYHRDELLYKPRNPRPHKVYGFGPVEQVIITVNIALRRQVSQLQYYTEGNIPDMLASVPSSWSPTQIGVPAALGRADGRRPGGEAPRLRFLPGDMKVSRRGPSRSSIRTTSGSRA
jgi:hypothetical protein